MIIQKNNCDRLSEGKAMVLYAHTTEVPDIVWSALAPLRLEFKLKSKEYMRLARWKRAKKMYSTDKRKRYSPTGCSSVAECQFRNQEVTG